MENIKLKQKWYILIVCVGLLAFSTLCWAYAAKTVAACVYHHVKNNPAMQVFTKLDDMIDDFDTKWYSSMFKKHIFSRVDCVFTYTTTGQIASSQVAKGKGKWLFYKSILDCNPIGDYEGTKTFSPDEINQMLTESLKVQKYFENRGTKFAIIIPPNKENVYSKFMPDEYKHTEFSRTDKLVQTLASNGVNIVSPKAELINGTDNNQLYYFYDTHWNQLGAYIGVRKVLSKWDIYIPSLRDRRISKSNLRDQYHACGQDDLAQMINCRHIFNDEIEYFVDGTESMDWPTFGKEEAAGAVSHFSNKKAKVLAALLLIGDSFRVSMLPSLREVFSDVYVVHRNCYTSAILNKINPDYVIAEWVERYSGGVSGIGSLIK